MFVDHTQKNGPIEKEVPFVLSDMVPEVFLAMLEFIYTNSVSLTPKIVSILIFNLYSIYFLLAPLVAQLVIRTSGL